MQIPGLDRFGGDQAAAPQRSDGAGVFNNGGAAVAAVAGAAGGIVQDLQQRQAVQQRAESALALAKITNQLHSAHDEVAQGVLSGTIDPDKAGQEMAKRSRDTLSSGMSGLRPEQTAEIAAHAESVTGNLDRNLQHVVLARKQTETASTIDQFGEQVQRQAPQLGAKWATEKYAAMVDFTGAAAGWTPETQSKKKQQFTEQTTYQFFDAAGTDAMTRFDGDGVKAVRERMEGAEGEAMDPKQRQQLRHQLYGWQQHIMAQELRDLAASAAAKDIREKQATEEYDRAFQLITSGQTPSPAYIKVLTQKASGTSIEPAIGELLQTQSGVAGFAARSASEREAILNQMRSRGSDPTQGTDPAQFKTLHMMETMHAAEISAAKENPWQGAQKYGRIPEAPLLPANATPDDYARVMGDRMKSIGQVEDWAGRKVSPLQPTEAEHFGTFVRTLTPDARAKVLGQIGATIDLPRLDALTEQIDKQDRPMALAMKLGTDQTTAGRNVSELLLRGAQAIKDKTVKRDDSVLTGWRADIAKAVRGTLGDQRAEDDVVDAAYFVRAAMDADGINAPGYALKQSVEQAVKLVAGLPIERNGVKTLLPKGYDENMFDDKLKTFTPEVLKGIAPSGTVYVRGKPLTVERLSSSLGQLGMRRDSQGYRPTSGGAFVTLDAAGQQPLRLPIQ